MLILRRASHSVRSLATFKQKFRVGLVGLVGLVRLGIFFVSCPAKVDRITPCETFGFLFVPVVCSRPCSPPVDLRWLRITAESTGQPSTTRKSRSLAAGTYL